MSTMLPDVMWQSQRLIRCMIGTPFDLSSWQAAQEPACIAGFEREAQVAQCRRRGEEDKLQQPTGEKNLLLCL